MTVDQTCQIYEDLGVRPMINAGGFKTILGGSRLSPAVLEAASLANRHFVELEDLLTQSGQVIADMLHVESALVTPGCFSAIALSAVACMTGNDPAKIGQLPDTTGLRNEFIIEKCVRYKYDRALSVFGGQIVEIGDEQGTTVEQLEAAITEQTAGIHHLAVALPQLPHQSDGLPLETIIRVAKAHNLPVIVDAASQIYPLELFHRYTEMGADLVCFGAKYFGGYNSTGLLCGRKDLVEAAYQSSFVSFELQGNRAVGRPLKLDRQEVVGVVAALRQWLTMDHEERLDSHEKMGQVVRQGLNGIAHISTAWEQDDRGLGSKVRVTVDEATIGKTAAQVCQELREGTPAIWIANTANTIDVVVPTLHGGEAEIVTERLQAALTAG